MIVAQDAPLEEEPQSEMKSESTSSVEANLETPQKSTTPGNRSSPVLRPKKAEPGEKVEEATDRVEDL